MATLHILKTGEKSDSRSWAKEGHEHRPQSDKGNDENLTQTAVGAEAKIPT